MAQSQRIRQQTVARDEQKGQGEAHEVAAEPTTGSGSAALYCEAEHAIHRGRPPVSRGWLSLAPVAQLYITNLDVTDG